MATASLHSAAPTLARATSPFFYKYSALTGDRSEWLRQIILEHRVYVPRLAELKDPSDGRPKLAPQTEEQLFNFLYASKFGVLGRNPDLTDSERLKQAVVLAVNIEKHGKDALIRDMAQGINKAFEDFRVYSLSKRFDNLSLWENYADNHSGYCLEFVNAGPFFALAMNMNYAQVERFDLSNPAHLNGYWFYSKKSDYQYEEEVRIVWPRSTNGSITIEPAWLNRIILGWKMPAAEKLRIREWAEQRQPHLNVAELTYDSFDQELKCVDQGLSL